MIDQQFLLGLAIGTLAAALSLLDRVLGRHSSRESTFISALQAELKRAGEENDRLRQALAESEAREKEWRALWNDMYLAGRAALLRPTGEPTP